MGNHDRRANEDIFGFDYRNYYTNIDDIGFYFINVQNRAIDAIVTKEDVDSAIKFLRNNINDKDKLRILIVHAPMYPERS